MTNKVLCSDNLQILLEIESESIDLIYLDPPFNTSREFEDFSDIFTSEQQAKEREFIYEMCADEYSKYNIDEVDTPYQMLNCHLSYLKGLCDESLVNYLYFIGPRLTECHRILKDTGSLYLHCDYHVNAELKLLLNQIFGRQNFRNELIWCYTMASNTKKKFPNKHDSILFYSKTKNNTFNKENIRIPYTNTKTGIFITKTGDFFGGKQHNKEKLQGLEERGKVPESWWVDIPLLNGKNRERVNYSTQKPLRLLRRIIEASSNRGDLILDPFCGSGTTLVACKQLQRDYIGIDQNPEAVKLSKKRLQEILI